MAVNPKRSNGPEVQRSRGMFIPSLTPASTDSCRSRRSPSWSRLGRAALLTASASPSRLSSPEISPTDGPSLCCRLQPHASSGVVAMTAPSNAPSWPVFST